MVSRKEVYLLRGATLLRSSCLVHKRALLNAEGFTVELSRIPLSTINEAMATYFPVCWNCHIAQTFRREHPELFVDRSVRPRYSEPQRIDEAFVLRLKGTLTGKSRGCGLESLDRSAGCK
jgi:hypothetical protein